MSIIVTLPYNPVWEELDWLKKHCPSYITNDVHRYINDDGFELGDVDRTDYFFGDEKEALMFRLRWSC
jgi:hypothetical protein